MGRHAIDLIGQRFGKLTVLERDPRKDTSNHVYWTCRCDCGAVGPVASHALRSGFTTSCGCLRGRTKPFAPRAYKTQQPARKATYDAWHAMVARCTNPDHPAWDRYGGRGISVCERWLIFENFLDDMGLRPDALTLHRIDNDRSYSADNCCWANWRTQARNRSTSKISPELLAEILTLHRDGSDTRKIAARVSLSYKTTTLVISLAEILTELQGEPSPRA